MNSGDEQLHERIQELLEMGHFQEGTKEYGIALQVADQGEASLSPKQCVVWEKGVLPILSIPITEEEEFRAALREDQAAEHFEKP